MSRRVRRMRWMPCMRAGRSWPRRLGKYLVAEKPSRCEGLFVLCGEGFVCRRPVEAGYGEILQAEVDAELGSVMNEVVEKHSAIEEHLWGGHDDLVAEAHGPDLLEVFVGHGGESLTEAGAALLETVEKILTVPEGEVGPLVRG